MDIIKRTSRLDVLCGSDKNASMLTTGPRVLNSCCTSRIIEVGIHEVQQVLGWIGVCRYRERDGFEVSGDLTHRAEIAEPPRREQSELVEETKGFGGWLMNARNDDELNPPTSVLYKAKLLRYLHAAPSQSHG